MKRFHLPGFVRQLLSSSVGVAIAVSMFVVPSHVQGQTDLAETVAEAFSLSKAEVVSLDFGSSQIGETYVAEVTIEGIEYEFELHPYSIRSKNFVLKEQREDGTLVEVDPGPSRTYRGGLRGDKGSLVIGSITEQGLGAKIIMSDGEVFFVEPVSSQIEAVEDTSLHVVYRWNNVQAHPGKCGVGNGPLHGFEVARRNQRRIRDFRNSAGPQRGVIPGINVAELAVDADFEYFTDWGSTQGTLNRMEQIINIVNNQYEEDVSITHIISGAVVRSTEPDPYTSTDAFTLLSQFRSEWLSNQGGIQRDVAHLFTGKSIQGGTIGIAWTIGGICTTSGYCLSESDFNNALVCATDLTAHELGHLWNGSHCNCNSFTMNPSITCANNFNQTFTVPDIIAHRDSRNCLDGSANPSNDNFVDSIFVGSLPANVAGTNVNATTEVGEPDLDETGSTVWWNATAPSSGIMTVSTAGSSYDTQLQIYTGSSVDNLQIVASNDDYVGTLQSQISFPVTGGQNYEIRVGGFTNGGSPLEGTVSLAVTFAAAGPTDFFWSDRNIGTGADNFSNPTINLEPGQSGSVYLYFDPTSSEVNTGAFFDLVTSNPGVIEFTNATSFDFDVTVADTPVGVRWGDAFGEVGDVTPQSIDEFGAFTVVGGDGMILQNTGPTFFDQGYDAAAGAFLFGRVDFNVIGAAGSSVNILTNQGTNGIVNSGATVDAALGSMTINVVEPLPAETDFFWSTADLAGGAMNGSMLMATASEGGSGSLFLYYDTMMSEIDTGALLDVMTSTTGVIEFTNAVSFDFDILAGGVPFNVRWGDAFGEVGDVMPNFIDEFGAFTVVSGTGIVNANTGPTFFDEGYDPATGAFLFGRIDYNVVGSAGEMVDISVVPGSLGIVNMGVEINPTFGIASILVTDDVLLGDINCDGVVNLLDVAPFVELLSNGEFSPKADFDGDGAVTLLDISPFVDALNSGG